MQGDEDLNLILQRITENEEREATYEPLVPTQTNYTRECRLALRLVSVDLGCDHSCLKSLFFEIEFGKKKNTIPLGPNFLDGAKNLAILEILEFYAPEKILFSIKKKGCFGDATVGTSTICLGDVISLQDRDPSSSTDLWVANVHLKLNNNSLRRGEGMENFNRPRSWLESLKMTYSPILQSSSPSSSTQIKSSFISVHLAMRIVQMQVCISPSPCNSPTVISLHNLMFCNQSQCTEKLLINLLEGLAKMQSLNIALSLRDRDGYSVLDRALLLGRTDFVRTLLQRAGKLCFQWKTDCDSALHYAVLGNSVSCLSILLKFLKKYICAYWIDRKTTAQTAHQEGLGVVSFAEMVEWRNAEHETPLLLACRYGDGNREDLANILIRAGADVAAKNSHNDTPLMAASRSGQTKTVAILLSMKISMRDMLSAKRHEKFHGILNPISQFKCQPASVNEQGQNALIIAAESGHTDIVKLLLTAGLSLTYTCKKGDSAFHVAARRGFQTVLEALLLKEASEWKAYLEDKNHRGMQTMIHRPKSLLLLNLNGHSSIQLAYLHGHLNLHKLLQNASVEIYGDSDKVIANCDKSVDGNTITYDDAADDAEYQSALAFSRNKDDPIQGYYSVLSQANAKQQEEEAEEDS